MALKIGVDLANGTDETMVLRIEPDKEPVVIDERDGVPICRDLDEDCAGLDHLHCYLYDIAKGRCPFLSSGRKLKI